MYIVFYAIVFCLLYFIPYVCRRNFNFKIMKESIIKKCMYAWLSVFLFACSSESLLTTNSTSINDAEKISPEGSMLMMLMQKQTGSYERFLRVLGSREPLYEHVTVASSEDYGLYYVIPYSDKDGTVEGCVIYPVDEKKEMDERTAQGELGVPVNMDSSVLNEEIPECRRYLYSWRFGDLQNQGLRVDSTLYSFARQLEKQQKSNLQTRATGNLVSEAYINLYYQVSSYGYVPPSGGAVVTTVSKETIMSAIDYNYRIYRLGGGSVELKNIYSTGRNCIKMKLGYVKLNPTETVARNDLIEQMRKIAGYIKTNHYVDIIFQYDYEFKYAFATSTGAFTSGVRTSCSGTKDTSGGVNIGGYDMEFPDRSIPCRNLSTGKANPLITMGLMAPNDYNFRGARFGYTRVDKNGDKKFHSGIDLVAGLNTPVYAMFNGVIVGPYVVEQPNKIGDDYPVGYKGDTNAAGNRFGVRSFVNGRVIIVYFWHLSADQPVAYRNGKPLQIGDSVYAGEIIGYTGHTGNASPNRPHLHLGIKNESGAWIDPELYLNATVTNSSPVITTPCDPEY